MVFTLILLAALLHASWNALVKAAPDKRLITVAVTTAAMAIAALGLPFLPAPAAAAWPYLAVSTGLQLAYFVLLARAYSLADMSQAYPLMRGVAPMLVALASLAGLGGPVGPGGWLGIGLLCCGLMGMAIGAQRRAVAPALCNSVVIAAYTLVDGAGVRHSGSPLAYTLWIYVLTGPLLLLWGCWHGRGRALRALAGHWRLGLICGAATVASYALALWAMTIIPVAVVAALRETSILFGVGLSHLALNEPVTPRRLAAACVMVAGAIVLRLA